MKAEIFRKAVSVSVSSVSVSVSVSVKKRDRDRERYVGPGSSDYKEASEVVGFWCHMYDLSLI